MSDWLDDDGKLHGSDGKYREKLNIVETNESLKAMQLERAQKVITSKSPYQFNPEYYKLNDGSERSRHLYDMAVQAAFIQNDEGVRISQLVKGARKGFIAYKTTGYEVQIEHMGSTGGGLGTKLLDLAANEALRVGKNLSWSAPEFSQGYYSHIGLDKYSIGGDSYKSYRVKYKDLQEFKKLLQGGK